jgi:hypothetical protein
MTKVFFYLSLLILSSCITYQIPVDSFQKQFHDVKANEDLKINNPFSLNDISYKGNSISKIKVIDKKGKELTIDNSPSIEIRITEKNGKKTIFYFDTVTLRNDTIRGSRSRLIGNLIKAIPLNQIMKIEVQDGKKDYNYQ